MKEKPVILIVDDQPQNLELLEAHLIPQGYEVVKAASGEEGLERLAGDRIDMVLLDVMMPQMNGYEVCRKLKQGTGYLPVIMITSLGDRDSRILGIECGQSASGIARVVVTRIAVVAQFGQEGVRVCHGQVSPLMGTS